MLLTDARRAARATGPPRSHGAGRARLIVDTAQGAIDAAMAGLGLVRVLSYQVDRLVASGALRIVLRTHEPAPLPVQIVQLAGLPTRTAAAFVQLAQARLRAALDPRRAT